MSRKSHIYVGAFIGSTIGGYVPTLWGAGVFSAWSIILGGIGGLLGIWATYRLTS